MAFRSMPAVGMLGSGGIVRPLGGKGGGAGVEAKVCGFDAFCIFWRISARFGGGTALGGGGI
jgi:hypothetical protein